MVGRQPVGLARDPAASLGVGRRDWRQEREVVGLGQAPAAAGDSAERHCGIVSRSHSRVCGALSAAASCPFVYKITSDLEEAGARTAVGASAARLSWRRRSLVFAPLQTPRCAALCVFRRLFINRERWI